MLRAGRGPTSLTSVWLKGHLRSRLSHWESFPFPVPIQFFPQRLFHWNKIKSIFFIWLFFFPSASPRSSTNAQQASLERLIRLMNLRQQLFGESFKPNQLLKLSRCLACQNWERQRKYYYLLVPYLHVKLVWSWKALVSTYSWEGPAAEATPELWGSWKVGVLLSSPGTRPRGTWPGRMPGQSQPWCSSPHRSCA